MMHHEEQKIELLREKLAPEIDALRDHDLYHSMEDLDAIRHFMSHHVFSVWDFMCLLTHIQQNLTCMTLPWYPAKFTPIVRLLSEIAMEESCDEIDGEYTSHFMYYVNALKMVGGAQDMITPFLDHLNKGASYESLVAAPYLPPFVKAFLETTYAFTKGPLLEAVVAFAFGREMVIPVMFKEIVMNPKVKEISELSGFVNYLERHIELDGTRHSEMAKEMVSLLCKTEDDWDRVYVSAKQALTARRVFWDGILDSKPN